MEIVLKSVNQLQELRSELFFSKLWKDVQSKIAEYGLQAITLPRHVNAKTPTVTVMLRSSEFQGLQHPCFSQLKITTEFNFLLFWMLLLSILLADLFSED